MKGDVMSLLNCKLYNKFYPVKNEDERTRFISENKDIILKYLNRGLKVSERIVILKKMEYSDKRKSESSSSGQLKPVDILNNTLLEQDMENDRSFYEAKDDVVIFSELIDNLDEGEFSIDDANYFLERYYKNHKSKIRILSAIVCSLVVYLSIYIFLLR